MGIKDDVIDMKKEVKQIKDEMPLMIPYVVYDAEMKRKQRLIYILLGILFSLVTGWLIYSCLPERNTMTQEATSSDSSFINQTMEK